MTTYRVAYTTDHRQQLEALPDDRARAAAEKAIAILANDPLHPFSMPLGDDANVRVIDATPVVRIRYFIHDDIIVIIQVEHTNYRPLFPAEGD